MGTRSKEKWLWTLCLMAALCTWLGQSREAHAQGGLEGLAVALVVGGVAAGGVVVGAVVTGIGNAVYAADGERPSNGWVVTGFVFGGLAIVGGTIAVAAGDVERCFDETAGRCEDLMLGIGSAAVGLGSFSVAMASWAVAQPRSSPVAYSLRASPTSLALEGQW